MRRLRLWGAPLLVGLASLSALAACSGPRVSLPLRDSRSVELALRRAHAAYIEGDYDQSVDETTPVLESRPDPAQLYEALKLRALATCRAQDGAPPDELARALRAPDREAVRTICAAASSHARPVERAPL